MSTRLASIILNPAPAAARDGAENSDLQQMVGKVLAVLRRRRWLFAIPLLAGMLGSLALSLTLPRRYQLSTIFERRDDVVITKLITDNSPYSFATLRQSLFINLVGYNALAQAVEDLGLTRDFPREAGGELTPAARALKQDLVLKLSKELDVSLLEKSSPLDLIEVRYRGSDPELGVRLVNRLKDNYIRNTSAWITDILVKSRDFFQQEVSRRSEQAARLDAELLETSIRYPGVDPGDPDLLHQRLLRETTAIEDLERRRSEMQSDLKAREEYLAELRSSGSAPLSATRPADLSPALVRNPEWQRIHAEAETLRTQIADARTLRRMTDQHPVMAGMAEKLRHLESELSRLPETLNRAASSSDETGAASPQEAEARRVNMELKSLREVLAQVERELPRRQAEQARLELEKGSLFERRQNYMMRQQEVQAAKNDLHAWNTHLETIARVLTAESRDRGIRFATVEEARRPSKPTSPTLFGVFTLSGAAGVALAVGLVFIREMLDRSYRSAARVRQTLGIPVLETIGEIPIGAQGGWLRLRCLLPAAVAVEISALAVLAALVYASIEEPAAFEQWVNHAVSIVNGS